ncbi:PLP-dependent aminotransferase family protein [Flavobacterium sp.]|uniref:aminotransferase-like domain-containing protein n=1 Tax=Flavobacterium sp. TaxID=239 RepID=UPI0025BFA0DF|nr:PLP-dependent aminotransferase family protein [Flavobacterium sp.]
MIEKMISQPSFDVVNPLLFAMGEDVMGFLNEVQLQYPDAISFASGRPDANYFKIDQFSECLDHFVKNNAREKGLSENIVLENLGQYNRTKGIINEEVAKYLSVDEAIKANPEDILITVGAQEAIAIGITTLCNRENDVILVEDPAYIGVTHFAKINDYAIDTIPVISDESSIQAIEEKILHYQEKGKKVKIVYVIPDFQNPTGNSMSLTNRHRLLELARLYDFVLFEDNAYGDFYYEKDKMPTLKSLDQNNSVIYLRSLSKTIYPSLRLCLMVVTQKVKVNEKSIALSDLMAKTKGYVTVNTPSIMQAMFGGLLLKNAFSLEALNTEKRAGMKEKRNQLLESLNHFFNKETHFWAENISWNLPAGGFFLILKVPFRVTKQDVIACAETNKVIFTPMSFFYMNQGGENELRLAFSNVTEEEIKNGIERLSEFIKSKVTNQ